jgi:hypothetical protein
MRRIFDPFRLLGVSIAGWFNRQQCERSITSARKTGYRGSNSEESVSI